MKLGERELCDRCASEHRRDCGRHHVPNVEGDQGPCLGDRCLTQGATIAPLPWLCVPREPD